MWYEWFKACSQMICFWVILQTKAYDWISSQTQKGKSVTSADVIAYVQVVYSWTNYCVYNQMWLFTYHFYFCRTNSIIHRQLTLTCNWKLLLKEADWTRVKRHKMHRLRRMQLLLARLLPLKTKDQVKMKMCLRIWKRTLHRKSSFSVFHDGVRSKGIMVISHSWTPHFSRLMLQNLLVIYFLYV